MKIALSFGETQVSQGGGKGAEDVLPRVRALLGTLTLWQEEN